ncbi:hypothetical protein ACFE04_011926 [Oxalis oulophora]
MNKKSKAASPNLPWKVKLHSSFLSFLVDVSSKPDGTVNRTFMNIAEFITSPSKKPINGLQTSDIMVDSTRNLWFRLYVPTTTTASLPVIVYFHGGGFVFMSPNSKVYHELCCRLARELPAIIISVNYRLAPEHRLPCQYEDGFDVLKFIHNEASGILPDNADLERCFVAGDSAGGNMAHHVVLKAIMGRLELKGLIAIQPFFGGEERTKSETELVGAIFTNPEVTDLMWKAVLPDGANRNHEAVNLYVPNSIDHLSRITDFPQTIVFVGGFDKLQDRQRWYWEGLKKSGKIVTLIEYPNAIHAFYWYPELPELGLLIKDIKHFVHKNNNQHIE